MAWRAPMPNFRLASCCSVEVMKGGAGLRVPGFASTLSIFSDRVATALSATSARVASPRS